MCPSLCYASLILKRIVIGRHEHHYVELGDQMVQTSDIFQDTTSIEDVLGKSKIVLCTLGMLSNPGLAEYGVFKHCPVERLIVDEASQIDTLDFMVRFSSVSYPPWLLYTPLSTSSTSSSGWRRFVCSVTANSVRPLRCPLPINATNTAFLQCHHMAGMRHRK